MNWTVHKRPEPSFGTRRTERWFALFPVQLWEHPFEEPKRYIWLEQYFMDLEYEYTPYSSSLSRNGAWFIKRKYQINKKQPMKTKLTIILTSLLLFVGTIYVLANYPYQTNTPVQKEEKKPIRVVLSLPDADTAMVQLANVYEAVERIECLTQGEGRKIKNQLVAVINKIQARVDTTGKK